MKKFMRCLLAVLMVCCIKEEIVMGDKINQDDKVEITFMMTGTGNQAKTKETELQELLQEDFPNVVIRVEAYPDEQYYNILNTRLSMGDGPDFFSIQPYLAGPNAVQKLASAGYLEPLEDLELVRNAPEEWKEPVRYNGHVYSLSTGKMILCTYYNKRIFEQLDLAVPENWTEFLEVCQKLKEAEIIPLISGNKDSYALQFGIYQIAASQVYAFNPDFNMQLKNGITHFTDPGTWNEVLDKYFLLYKNQYVQEHSLSMSVAEAVEQFAEGKAAMIFSGDFQYRQIASEMGTDVLGMFPLPANQEGYPLYTVVSKSGGNAIYSGSENINLCKKIFEKMYEGSVQEKSDVWDQFLDLKEAGQYTINCNQGWKGDVEWVMEDGVSRKIGGDSISADFIAQQMQDAYDKG